MIFKKKIKSREEVLAMLSSQAEEDARERIRKDKEEEAKKREKRIRDTRRKDLESRALESYEGVVHLYRPWAAEAQGTGGVYFIQHGESGPIKIGLAQDIAGRRLELQSGNPVELRTLGYIDVEFFKFAVEKSLHEHFAPYRIRGEWFQPCQEILKLCGLEVFANG